ncbi:MAG: TolC family protein [Planctomycetota bacterium]
MSSRGVARMLIGLTLLGTGSGCVGHRELTPVHSLSAGDFTRYVTVVESSGDRDEGRKGVEDGADLWVDLPLVLELAGASNLQIALARERLEEARARLDEAAVLWWPSIDVGPRYTKHEGRIQDTRGEVIDASRNAGFAGVVVHTTFDLADAFYEPLAARRLVAAQTAAVAGQVNETLRDVALGYVDLAAATASLALAREAVSDATELLELAEGFARTGEGLEADAARARSELASRKRDVLRAEEKTLQASVRLASLLHLEPTTRLRPRDDSVIPLRFFPANSALGELLDRAFASRPELVEARANVEAERERQTMAARRPYWPELELAAATGGFGGGDGSSFDDSGARGDLSVALVWRLENLGCGDSARERAAASRLRQAEAAMLAVQDEVAGEVGQAYWETTQRGEQLELARENLEASLQSLDLNLRRIRAGEGLPIEALQAIQAAAQARDHHLEAIVDFNRSQFRLLHAVGDIASGEEGNGIGADRVPRTGND